MLSRDLCLTLGKAGMIFDGLLAVWSALRGQPFLVFYNCIAFAIILLGYTWAKNRPPDDPFDDL